MPGNGSIGIYGLAVDNCIVDTTTMRKVMQLSNIHTYILYVCIYVCMYVYELQFLSIYDMI